MKIIKLIKIYEFSYTFKLKKYLNCEYCQYPILKALNVFLLYVANSLVDVL